MYVLNSLKKMGLIIIASGVLISSAAYSASAYTEHITYDQKQPAATNQLKSKSGVQSKTSSRWGSSYTPVTQPCSCGPSRPASVSCCQ